VILVDSNIWIDLIQEDRVWLDWSLAQVQPTYFPSVKLIAAG